MELLERPPIPATRARSIRAAKGGHSKGRGGTWRGGKEKAPAAICRKVAECYDNGVVEIWGDGEQTRSFLYIEECIEATILLMRSNFSGPVNIGSDEMVTINTLLEIVKKISGKTFITKHIDGPLGVRGRNSDNRLIEQKLGWRPTQSLEEGLLRTFKWIKGKLENS